MSNNSKRVRVGWERSRGNGELWQLAIITITILAIVALFVL